MFPYLAPYLEEIWGPFRLLGSYLALIGFGAGVAAILTAVLIPRFSYALPRDQGRMYTPTAEAAKGKPTGAGLVLVLLSLPLLVLVMPLSVRFWGIIGCLVVAMLTGYMDDRSARPWNEYVKGALDLAVAVGTSLVICQGEPFTIWLPLISESYNLPVWGFVPLASILLWISINTTNCSDGVDGLAGGLTLLTLFYLGAFLYVVIGHVKVADYLLLPHNPDGAQWTVLILTLAGALGGYLWHNAEPSQVLMGDAGSRFLGLLVGIAVLATGNPFVIIVVAPVVLINGGSGLLKVAVLRGLRQLGVDITPAINTDKERALTARKNGAEGFVQFLHGIRFPLHDHCRKNLKWSNAQVLMRFMLIQAFLTPILLGILIKLR